MSDTSGTPSPDIRNIEPFGGTIHERLNWLRRQAVETENDHAIFPRPGGTTVSNRTLVAILEHIDELQLRRIELENPGIDIAAVKSDWVRQR